MAPVAIRGSVSGVMPKRHLEAATPEARAKMRKSLGTLKQLTVQPATRQRYNEALGNFFKFLDSIHRSIPPSAMELDLLVSDYLEHLWAKGFGRSTGSNTLAALQDSQPHLKGKLLQSWRLMKAWVVHEVPNRAPPLPLEHLEAMVGYSLFKQRPAFALSLLVGYFGLLRTGEILSLKAAHISVAQPKGPAVLSLGLTKAGKRQGAAESVTIYVEDVCRRLFQWKSQVSSQTKLAGSNYLWRKTFNDTLIALDFSAVDFRPYSLRRGGATHFFTHQGSFDRLLVLGRWQSSRTARIYVNEGMSVLTELNLKLTPFARNVRAQYLRSFTQPLPKLSQAPKRVQSRGSWKKHEKKKNRKKKAH